MFNFILVIGGILNYLCLEFARIFKRIGPEGRLGVKKVKPLESSDKR